MDFLGSSGVCQCLEALAQHWCLGIVVSVLMWPVEHQLVGCPGAILKLELQDPTGSIVCGLQPPMVRRQFLWI